MLDYKYHFIKPENMSSAGASAITKGMRKNLQEKYKQQAKEYLEFLSNQERGEVKEHFQLICYNLLFIPNRYFFTLLGDGNFYIKEINSENIPERIVVQKPEEIRVVTQKAGIYSRLQQPAIGEYLKIENKYLPKGKYIVENLEGFGFQDKERQAEFLKLFK